MELVEYFSGNEVKLRLHKKQLQYRCVGDDDFHTIATVEVVDNHLQLRLNECYYSDIAKEGGQFIKITNNPLRPKVDENAARTITLAKE